MSAKAARLVAAGFVGGVAAGGLVWSQLQRQFRHDLFSSSPFRRVAALGFLRARPGLATAQILREYIAWEQRPLLRARGARMLRRLEAAL